MPTYGHSDSTDVTENDYTVLSKVTAVLPLKIASYQLYNKITASSNSEFI
jgi:hypothetical protein